MKFLALSWINILTKFNYSVALETKEPHLQTTDSKTCYNNYPILDPMLYVHIYVNYSNIWSHFTPLKCKNPYSFWGLHQTTRIDPPLVPPYEIYLPTPLLEALMYSLACMIKPVSTYL